MSSGRSKDMRVKNWVDALLSHSPETTDLLRVRLHVYCPRHRSHRSRVIGLFDFCKSGNTAARPLSASSFGRQWGGHAVPWPRPSGFLLLRTSTDLACFSIKCCVSPISLKKSKAPSCIEEHNPFRLDIFLSHFYVVKSPTLALKTFGDGLPRRRPLYHQWSVLARWQKSTLLFSKEQIPWAHSNP